MTVDLKHSQIRERQEGDLPAILRLYARLSREIGEPIAKPPDLLDGKCFVAEAEGRPVGFCLVKRIEVNGRAMTQGLCLYIEPEYRRSSLSRSLYRTARSYARHERLTVILISDPKNVQQWQKAGYRVWKVLMTRSA